ncbi:prolipoprotein diacylglyceryl transferase [Neosynechococcus sphagnicola sy1]|uniref:Phosphatidylglycerol--prolipoprotein diacylglyceryl transferase n=1 Tax=Neosynechococcus sphagnicola sy1 TaxID=1497020 RepID=A0A098TT75_9CYAN|nr:prolipoprotein diacylglyceryl transferase [Neosynechococcus sphagnicola]KGF73988.1 prolipoprotein diacylglyceryl transferase [Neosynechococcus sphagnicola sy1]
MLTYPELSPIALKLGPLTIHWYGLMYLLGFLSGWVLLQVRIKSLKLNWTVDQLSDLVIYLILGVVFGGRLGYVLFYDFLVYLQHPLKALAIWDGGMSFHGGLIGVIVAISLYGRKNQRKFFEIADFIVPVVPIGLGTGRIGNFINGELWGKVANLPWAMQLPCADSRFVRYCNGATTGYSLPKHPSQLYEFFLEGIVLFTVLWCFSHKPRPRMAVSGLFALLYGVFRFIVEFVRLPDVQLGYLAFGWLTMGQVLSLPLILIGMLLLGLAYSRKNNRLRQTSTSQN